MKQPHAFNFDLDSSLCLRAFAVICMIIIHHNYNILFIICVPLLTFLAGYGYALTRHNKYSVISNLQRITKLLASYWLILFTLFIPCGVLSGEYRLSFSDLLLEMVGFKSDLNGYNWYVYFYIYAMMVMIPASRLIRRYGIPAILIMNGLCVTTCIVVHMIPGWNENIFYTAIWQCALWTPVLFSGYFCAIRKIFSRYRIRYTLFSAIILLTAMTAILLMRKIPYLFIFDFITIPLFVLAFTGITDMLRAWKPEGYLYRSLRAIGKESMNIWLVSAIFTSAGTGWLFSNMFHHIHTIPAIILKIIISFILASFYTRLYRFIKTNLGYFRPQEERSRER